MQQFPRHWKQFELTHTTTIARCSARTPYAVLRAANNWGNWVGPTNNWVGSSVFGVAKIWVRSANKNPGQRGEHC